MNRSLNPTDPRVDAFLAGFSEEPGYLDYARFGPISAQVVAESAAQLDALSRARFGAFDRLAPALDRFRAAAAALTGFRDDQLVFQPGATEGLAQVLFGTTGGVLVARDESPAITASVVRASETVHALAPIWLDTDHGRVTPGQIRNQLTSTTTALAVSAVDAQSGYLADLEGIREVIGERLLVVDATNAFGVVDQPWTAADVLAVGGETWLRAGFGTGFLALSDRAVNRLTPMLSGPGGYPDGEPVRGAVPPAASGAAGFQLGAPDLPAAARLATALDELIDVGIEAVVDHLARVVDAVLDLADEHAIAVVSARHRPERAGIVVLEPAPDRLTALTAALHNAGVSTTIAEGRVRLSPHAGTSDETIALLRTALLAYSTASHRGL